MYPPQKKCEGRPGVLLDQRWFGCRFSIIRMDEGGGGMNVWTLCVSALWGKKKKEKSERFFKNFCLKQDEGYLDATILTDM